MLDPKRKTDDEKITHYYLEFLEIENFDSEFEFSSIQNR